MVTSKILLFTIAVAVLVSTVAAQFGGLFDLGFGFGGKPFGRPGFGGLGGKPGGFGRPGKPGGLGGFGGGLYGLGDLYRYNNPENTGVPYYNWEHVPMQN